jgi:hypothetical protein
LNYGFHAQSIAQWFAQPSLFPAMNTHTQLRLSCSTLAAARANLYRIKLRYWDQSLPSVMRQRFHALCVSVALIGASFTGHVHASAYTLTFPNWIQINGPDTPADAPAWLAAMQAYRTQQAALLSYDDSVYEFPALNWTQHNPIQPQAMAHDRYLYDVTTGTYTVDKYLADVRTRYGGIDSILIWPTYPNLGVDSRNQDQMIRDMPGFPNGVKKMIADFHKHGVKVLFPYNPWDIGTHDPGAAWSEVLPKTVAEIGADGMNGDTERYVDNEFFQNSLIDKQPLALEPELGVGTGFFFPGAHRSGFRRGGDSMEHHGMGILANPLYFAGGKPA